MIITDNFDIPVTSILGPADTDQAPRSPGLHLSKIYQSLDDEVSADSRKRKSGILLPQLEVYRSAGFIWERVFSRAMADSLANEEWVRPEEFVRDGVACSPDLIGLRDWTLGETKFTWKSSRRVDEMKCGTGPLWIWLVQIKGYCHIINTNRARLFAYFVNGDYKNMQPQWRVMDIEFTSMELRENWDMLIAHARRKQWL